MAEKNENDPIVSKSIQKCLMIYIICEIMKKSLKK